VEGATPSPSGVRSSSSREQCAMMSGRCWRDWRSPGSNPRWRAGSPDSCPPPPRASSSSGTWMQVPRYYQCCELADPDPGFGAFLTPGSGMGKKIRIRDEQLGLYFRELRNKFDADPRWEKFGSGINISDMQH
jgi:hypothetical protein